MDNRGLEDVMSEYDFKQDDINENENDIENIASEKEDQESEPEGFEVLTYPADYTLEGLFFKYEKKALIIPGFQRKYVWTIKQASRLIESFLLGLPVPAVFLYADVSDSNKLLVIDGQQRLLSIVYYFKGYFGDEVKGKKAVFSLKGLNENSPYNNMTYAMLESENPSAFNKLNDSILRAFIVKQMKPDGDSSIYSIFERLNTGGTQLVGQEIRNCIYHGSFNEKLIELNKYENWRKIYGRKDYDKRQRDVDLILRFIALFKKSDEYKKPMKEFLSRFMETHRNCNNEVLDEFARVFMKATDMIVESLGEKPFHIRSGLNVAAYDSVFIAFAKNEGYIPEDIKERYSKLKEDDSYKKYTSTATTDVLFVRERLNLAIKVLFGD